MAERSPAVLVTCEHGGNQVPSRYRALFDEHARRLNRHHGYDLGALPFARRLARRLGASLYYAEVTRLLVDLNRSPHHPALFSEVTRALPTAERERILNRYYRPYRQDVESWIADRVKNGANVVHLSIHSFTPVLKGVTRNADAGLLYDPGRRPEARFCRAWQLATQGEAPRLRLRRNYPYRGTSDGFTCYLRRRFAPTRYIGIELELNQCRLTGASEGWCRKALDSGLIVALEETLRAWR